MNQPVKKWYQSATVWINGLSLLIEFLNLLVGDPASKQFPQFHAILASVLTIANLFLRVLKTSQAIDTGQIKDTKNEVPQGPN